MGDGLNIRGVVGQIKWSYYIAAAIEGYTVRRDKSTKKWSVSGRVIQSDAFKLRQRPLMFVAPHAKGEWRWPILTHQIIDGAFRADLGEPDK